MSDNGYIGLLAVANGWKTRALAAEAERDALAAHVERITDAWMIDDTGIHDKRIEHVRLPYLRYESVNQAIMSAPNTSLARRDAEKQAEALEEAANDCVPAMHQMANWLRARASEYRRQAEEAAK